MADDHEMRAGCAVEFGKIQASLDFHKEWRDEQRMALSGIKKEVEKLTGNGNKGRIETLGDQLSEIHRLLASHLSEAEARDLRIEEHTRRLDSLENRVYKIAIGAAAIAAVLVPLVDLLIKYYL